MTPNANIPSPHTHTPCHALDAHRKLLGARDRRLRLTQGGGGNKQAGRDSYGCAGAMPLDNHNTRLSIPNGSSERRPGANRSNEQIGRRAHLGEAAEAGEVNLIDVEAEPRELQRRQQQQDPSQLVRAGSGRSNKLQQLARNESLRNELVVSRTLDSDDSGGGGGAAARNIASATGTARTNLITPHSGSSCATDAECLPASCGASSSGSLNNSLEQAHQRATAAPQVYGNPLSDSAESAAAGPPSRSQGATAQQGHLMAKTKQGVLMGQPSGGLEEGGSDGNEVRSASTCGALELYAHLDEPDGETSCRLTAVTPAPTKAGQLQQQLPPQVITRPGLAASAQEFNRNSDHRGQAEAGPFGRNSKSHSNLRAGNNRDSLFELGEQNNGRGRSIGSATFAPLQIVKLQASQRQLSQNETTTRLLIAVMILFLVCEFPAGILSALCAILGQDFFDNVYQPMGSLTDLFALINSSVNFILYCFMSTQFRVTFYRVVMRCPAPNVPKASK